MSYIVKLQNATGDFFLRGTVWAFSEDRATRFDTEELARAALLKAKPFMKAKAFKEAKVVGYVAHIGD